MFNKLKNIGKEIRREIRVYQLILRDVRAPKVAKALLGLAIAYSLSPIDIIPDFIPVIGHVDDIIIVPTLVFFALKFVPKEVVEECRRQVNEV